MVEETHLENWLTRDDPEPIKNAHFFGLDPLAKAAVVSHQRELVENPIVIVSGTKHEARALIDHLTFFLKNDKRHSIHYLPPYDFDYFRGVLPNQETLAERNASLFHALNSPKGKIFVIPLAAALQKSFSKTVLEKAIIKLEPNVEIERGAFLQTLVSLGYQKNPTVYDPGTFAVRGGIIDLFVPLYERPVRIEFYGDYIEEINTFDEKTQLTREKIERVDLIPVGLTLLPSPETFEATASKIKHHFDATDIPKNTRDEFISDLRDSQILAEHQFLFPLLSGGSSSILEYFPKDTLFFAESLENLLDLSEGTELPRLTQNHGLFQKNGTPIAAVEELFITADDLKGFLKDSEPSYFETFSSGSQNNAMTVRSDFVSFKAEREAQSKSSGKLLLDGFISTFRDWMDRGYRVHLVVHTRTHLERLKLLLSPYQVPVTSHVPENTSLGNLVKADFSSIHIWQGYITESRLFPNLSMAIISEEEIFGTKKRAAKQTSTALSASDAQKLLSTFRDLKEGDFVVHKEFGIGRYLGLKSMNFQGVENDYVLLEYQDGDKLYIPIYRLNILQKYVGGENTNVRVDKLGTDQWAKVKSKAQRAIAELAAEFLNIQAKRKLIPAHAFPVENQDFRQFEMEFPFDETPDQQKAIDEVGHDLSQSHPMDRLVCGDVGYGKTEVAMRAACKAVLGGKQVAVLVPTTVLAFQHFQNFKARFQHLPIRVEVVSRLKTNAEVKKILAELKEGKVDILIGTHRLLSPDAVFKDLQLLIVDEEHRFGVVHKERLKKMAESIHVLSMTATPIPRTLNMAMTGIKDISIITTPPPDRLSIRTFVCRNTDEVIAESISNELARDGQVFFVHNRIESIFGIAEKLKRIVPKADFDVVHGQMDADVLETKMLDFYSGKFHVLLTTAIIESGLDVPRANTIIIDQADRFGLAQLYQLRGRVGRSDKRAYCYLLAPPESALTADAKQRLQVIQRHTDLGAGFNIASHDLEIRGSGDLLGRDQHGHLSAIGVDLYFELLEDSIRTLRGQEKLTEIEPEINMKIAAFFPLDYLPDIAEKVNLYRRLSSADSDEKISEIESQIQDRFGPLPEEVVNLLGLMTLKLYLKKLHVTRMSCGPKRTSLQFAETTPAKPDKLVKLIQSNPKLYAITPDHKFVFSVESTDWRAQLLNLQKLITLLGA